MVQAALLGRGAGGVAHVAADTEGPLPAPVKTITPDRLVVGRRLEGLGQLTDGLAPEGVQAVRAVDRDRRAAVGHLVQDVLEVGHGLPFVCSGWAGRTAILPGDRRRPPCGPTGVSSRIARRGFVQWASVLLLDGSAVVRLVRRISHETRLHHVRQEPETTTTEPLEETVRAVSPRYRIQAIERAVAILNVFSTDEPELGVTEIADRSGCTSQPSTGSWSTWTPPGWSSATRAAARYRLGLHIFELGGLVMQRMNLWDEALPFLEGLVRDTGETGHLAVLDGGEAIYIERVEARRPLRVPSAIGRGYPAHATNLGKVLLADLPRERVVEIVATHGLRALHAQHDHRAQRARGRARAHPRPRLCDRRRGVRRGPAVHRCGGARPQRSRRLRARDRRAGHPDHARAGRGAVRLVMNAASRALPPIGRAPVRRIHPRRPPGAHHRGRAALVRPEQSMSRPPPVGVGRTSLPALPHPSKETQPTMATTATNPLRLSSRTSHFVLPKQWASMRKAEALERETGKRVIHFEKGDFQGDEFRPGPPHHGGLCQGRRRRPRALRPGPRPARAARRDRRGGHQARPADGARGGPGHDGRQARPHPVPAHDRRPGRRGDLPEPGLPARRVLDHLRRRHGGATPRWSSRTSTSTSTRCGA